MIVVRSLQRLLRIGFASLVLLFSFPLCHLYKPSAAPRLLVWYFQFCGGSFIKLGQLLAMRYDLLPPNYIEALATLLSQPRSPHRLNVRLIIERELGQPLEHYFAHFDETPIGSGSIAQVYSARLINGDPVVVKIKHPASEQLYKIDLRILVLLAQGSRAIFPFLALDLAALIQELVRLIHLEFDFQAEARNIQVIRDLMLGTKSRTTRPGYTLNTVPAP
jgi:ubiquinone biosynthesis protein